MSANAEYYAQILADAHHAMNSLDESVQKLEVAQTECNEAVESSKGTLNQVESFAKNLGHLLEKTAMKQAGTAAGKKIFD